jgi:hypothetical protein
MRLQNLMNFLFTFLFFHFVLLFYYSLEVKEVVGLFAAL